MASFSPIGSLVIPENIFSIQTACLPAGPAIQAPGRMPDYNVQIHKGHLVYGAAMAAAGEKRWYAVGIVFSTEFLERVEQIYRMKSKLDFRTEKQAREHAIALCKIWIDRQRGKKNAAP